jgi:hypothetical protein
MKPITVKSSTDNILIALAQNEILSMSFKEADV